MPKQTSPWVQKDAIGFFKGLWETIKAVLLTPAKFFDDLEINDSHWTPVSFYLTVVITSAFLSLLWNVVFGKMTLIQLFFTVFIVCIILPIFLYIGAGIIHLLLLIMGAQGGFMGTLNVICYGAATNIFSIIPFIGSMVGGIWGIVVTVKGYKRVHNLTTIRVVCATVIPLALILVALLAAIAIPNLLRARMAANEALAQASIKTISTAIESYKANHKKYPSDEYDLKYPEPSYLSRSYNNREIQGYRYSETFSESSYEITAEPVKCQETGSKTFSLKSGGTISEEKCK